VGNQKFQNVRVTANMKFVTTPQCPSWIGIAVRSSHYFANYGYLLYAGTDGHIKYTEPKNEVGVYVDKDIGEIPPHNSLNENQFLSFEIRVDDNNLTMEVNKVRKVLPLADLPYVIKSGHILLQTCKTRVGIQSLKIESL
jgi:hypothetical protein